ncbi:hypothetical protein BDF14DRAFT_1867737 [Spinellus fusiger]|nr:hypothetical protein BDF14DRAFT_1867737 [Spinellus fusiger]
MENSLKGFSYIINDIEKEQKDSLFIEPPPVPPEHYHAHIPSHLPHLDRLRQLLVWCAYHTKLKGRLTSDQQLLSDCQQRVTETLAKGAIDLNWYRRDASKQNNTKKRPNPRNIVNQERMEALQKELDR